MRSRWSLVILALIAGLIGGLLGVKLFAHHGNGTSKETAYERVMRTGVLRCAWAITPPVVMKDPSTGKLSGLYVELMNALEPLTGLKVEWPAEVDWGQVGAALDGGKADIFCAGMWPDSKRARGMAFLTPLFYNQVGMLVRKDDTRFPGNTPTPADLANSPNFTACVLEGDVTQAVVQSDLPKAKTYTLPQMSSWGDMITAIQSKKCDFVIGPRTVETDVQKQGLPVRYVSVNPPLRVYGVVPVIGREQYALKEYLDAVLAEFITTPAYDRIMKKYEAQYPGALSRPANAYKE
jgi:ABC-type amino acid transport substrate-binding protein